MADLTQARVREVLKYDPETTETIKREEQIDMFGEGEEVNA